MMAETRSASTDQPQRQQQQQSAEQQRQNSENYELDRIHAAKAMRGAKRRQNRPRDGSDFKCALRLGCLCSNERKLDGMWPKTWGLPRGDGGTPVIAGEEVMRAAAAPVAQPGGVVEQEPHVDGVGQQRRLMRRNRCNKSCCCDALTSGLLLSAICEGDHTSLAVPDYNPKGIAS